MTAKTGKRRSKPKQVRFNIEDRTRLILTTARAMFIEKGYADTSLNDIIRVAGGSKATLIQQFTGKAGLFAAVIEGEADRLASTLKDSALSSGSPQQALQRMGEAVLSFYLDPASLVAYRGVIAEGVKHPEIARAIYLRGHEHIVQPIAAQLKAWHQQGLLANADFHHEADRFTHMLRNGIYEQHLLGFRHRSTRVDITTQVAGAVSILLKGLSKKHHNG